METTHRPPAELVNPDEQSYNSDISENKLLSLQ